MRIARSSRGPWEVVFFDDVNSLAIDSSGQIFAGALGGAFLSTNDGDSWSDISSGLIPVGGNVWTVAIGAEGALAGTAGGGVFRSAQPATGACPVPLTHWRKDPALWPVDTLTLASQSYDKSELLAIVNIRIGSEGETDASLLLAHQLIAAKLKLASGSAPAPVSSTIECSDELLSRFPGKLPYNVERSSRPGRAMFRDATVLGDYNHGNLTPGCTP
jgi:hypothetical protein